MSAASSRAARWASQRASWRLANRGDTHFAADRRLYKQQMTELRKEWHMEDLLSRRAAYAKARDAKLQAAEARAASAAQSAADAAQSEQHEAERVAREKRRISLQKQEANALKVSARQAELRLRAETEFRRKWLKGVLQDYDVQGGEMSGTSLPRERRRSWLTRDNFDKRLHMVLMRTESPVNMWNLLARQLQADEEKAALAERLGGRLQPAPWASPPSEGHAAAAAPAAPPAAGSVRPFTLAQGEERNLEAVTDALLRSAPPTADDPTGGRPAASTAAPSADGRSSDATPPPPGGAAAAASSAKDAAFIEELKQTIAELDAADKEPPSDGSAGDGDASK
jgi:hypothetical protein